ncbi:MAG: hypothetical protein ACE5HE_03805, partial [Phycisphaerae bacterium]
GVPELCAVNGGLWPAFGSICKTDWLSTRMLTILLHSYGGAAQGRTLGGYRSLRVIVAEDGQLFPTGDYCRDHSL